MKDSGIVNIKGKDYMTVAKRVELALADGLMEVRTEVLFQDPVVIRARVVIAGKKGDGPKTYTGISSANPLKLIEKENPYEVAETSAVGRALGFAGYGIIEGIASADEVVKATREPVQNAVDTGLDFGKCPIHDEQMIQRTSNSTGKLYTSHVLNGKHCFGK